MTTPLLLVALLAGSGADTTLRLPRGGTIEVETRTRDIIVRTGSSDLVTVRGASAELDGSTLQISGDDRGNRGNGAVEVTVPTWARVDVSTVGGNLTFTGAPDHLHAETIAGYIHLTGGSGTADIETVAGPVVVTDFRGMRLSIDAADGPITVTNATGALTIDNINGDVTLHGIRSNRVSASTVNGLIDFEGPLAATGRYDFSAQNENVTLTLPADVSARMKISTMHGQLVSPQISATTSGGDGAGDKGKSRRSHDADDDGEHTFTVTYGNGAAQVTIDIFNGNVIVKKKG